MTTRAEPREDAETVPGQRRSRILSATVDVVRERGFAGTRVADIARAAGTSSGLVLYHFGSLAGALAEALTRIEDTFYADVEQALATTDDPVARLRLMARLGGGVGPSADEWVLWLELWVRALREESAAAARRSLDARWRTALRHVIDHGLATGVFRVPDPGAATLRLACLMDGLAVQLALHDGSVDTAGFGRLWLEAAALELGVDRDVLIG